MAGFSRNAMLASVVFAALFSTPAQAQSPDASQAQDLSNCAGAVAAEGNLDVLDYPRGASGEWAPVLGRILEALNREEGVEGMTGRYAANAAKEWWAEWRPEIHRSQEEHAAQRAAMADECRARFGS
jgi:hypothetical protein